MGVCSSSSDSGENVEVEKRDLSKHVDHKLAADATADLQVKKLLLLGAGGSGKSTLFKQIIAIYGEGFSVAEREKFIADIHMNIVDSVKMLCDECDKYGKLNPIHEPNREAMRTMDRYDIVDTTVGAHIKSLWSDPAFKNAFDNRAHFHLMDSAAYFLDRIGEICAESYIPTEADVLRCRVPTTGIVESEFTIDKNKFKILDVGGQRSERKKWIHCFEGVTGLLFVASLSEFNQVLYEDANQNRMREALDVFEDLVNSEAFAQSSVMLFLNKNDLLIEKIKTVNIGDFFREFLGNPRSHHDVSGFIQSEFEARVHSDKEIYPHLTCATDTQNVFHVFNSVKDTIMKRNLAISGLL